MDLPPIISWVALGVGAVVLGFALVVKPSSLGSMRPSLIVLIGAGPGIAGLAAAAGGASMLGLGCQLMAIAWLVIIAKARTVEVSGLNVEP